jgi:hypothetical protein
LEEGSLRWLNVLFSLSINKKVSVAEMRRLDWGVGGEGWRWQRRLFAWEERMVEEYSLLFVNIALKVNVFDR